MTKPPRRGSAARSSNQSGFTLVEILVVMLLISILAAISIPMFLRQRDKGYVAQLRSALRGAATAAHAAVSSSQGDYSVLDQNPTLLAEEGFRPTDGVQVGISADEDSFCVAAIHERLSADNEWKTGGFDSDVGSAAPGAAVCPQAAELAEAMLPPIVVGDDSGDDSGAGSEETGDSAPAEGQNADSATDTVSPGGDSVGTGDPSSSDGSTATDGSSSSDGATATDGSSSSSGSAGGSTTTPDNKKGNDKNKKHK